MAETELLVEDVNAQEASEEAFKQSVAGLLFSFKELVGEGQWMSVNGGVDGRSFCVAVAVEEKADILHDLIVTNFGDEE